MKSAVVLADASNKQPSIGARKSADAELLDRIVGGDKLAIKVLFARQSVRVYRFVLRFVNDAALAEDLVNDVFAPGRH
jgi:hypothetical protein